MLAVGQLASSFTLMDKDGKKTSLSDFWGQKVVLYFYPKDDTPGCTTQACAFRDSFAEFAQRKVPVIGISRDSTYSHQKFSKKYNLPFILLADTDGSVIAAYGVKGAFGASRTTFIISEDGLIEKVFEKATPASNAAEILKHLRKQDKMDFLDAMKNRRSFYGISDKSTITNERIIELVRDSTKYTPSAFNNQSQMTVILFGAKHRELWDIVLNTLRKHVPASAFSKTEEKIASFRAGYGTVLYFNDDSITQSLQKDFPLYADNFPIWAEQAIGMLQFSVWSLLESEGLGASLQHYNPLVDDAVNHAFGLPKSWRLTAQMPFGVPTVQPDAKEFADIDRRVRVIG